LFRYDLLAVRRTELLIILTPHVVRSEADANEVKQMEAARMSWCLGDVNAIQGETGIFRRGESELPDGDTTVIYPDDNPRGETQSRPEPIRGAAPLPPGELPGPSLVPAPPEPGIAPPIVEPDLPAPETGAQGTQLPTPGSTLPRMQVGTVSYPAIDEPAPAKAKSGPVSKLRAVFKNPMSRSGATTPVAAQSTSAVQAAETATSKPSRSALADRPDAKDYLPQPAKKRNLNRP
jgi:hypothetical protein